MSWILDPSWDPSTLWTYLFIFFYCPCRVRPQCGLWFWSLVGSIHLVDLFQFVILVGSVHVVDCGLDHPWGPSTLWTYLSFLPMSSPSTLWTVVLTLGGVRPLCGFVYVFYPCRVRPRCGLGSWPLVGSVHFMDLYMFSTLVGSVHVVDCGLDP